MTTKTDTNDINQVTLPRRSTNHVAVNVVVPPSDAESVLVTYRSAGIGLFGLVMRYAGMPLEKIALYMNSSQVSGRNQFSQSVRLTFQDGLFAPYRVVGKASVVAWFFQYSIMGFAFQFFDHGLSELMGVKPVYYGQELMEPPTKEKQSVEYRAKSAAKTLISPFLAAALESKISNRAEAQRYFGKETFAQLESRLGRNLLARAVGPAFLSNTMRNVIVCQTSFVLTPVTYKLYFPQEHKSKTSLFLYGLSMNMFVGNVFAITQQALWGRSLDYCARHGTLHYGSVIRESLKKEGMKAFFTTPKWFSRVLMNAPAQGVLPWFYNEVLPLGEKPVLDAVEIMMHHPFLHEAEILREQARGVYGSTPITSLQSQDRYSH